MGYKLGPALDYDPFAEEDEESVIESPGKYRLGPELDYDPFENDPQASNADEPDEGGHSLWDIPRLMGKGAGGVAKSASLAFALTNPSEWAARAAGVYGDFTQNEAMQSYRDFSAKHGVSAKLRQYGETAEDYYDEKLTPAMKKSMEKTILASGEEEGFWGPGIKDPWKIGGMIAESLPSTAISMGSGALVTKGLAATGFKNAPKIVQGVLQKLIKKYGVNQVAGAIGGGIGEGAFSGLDNANQAFEEMQAVPQRELAQSKTYQEIFNSLPANFSNEKKHAYARKILSMATGGFIGALTSVSTGILGAPSGAFVGKLMGGEGGKSLWGNLLKGAFTEGIIEEMPQSGMERFITNFTKKFLVDPNQRLTEGVGEAMAGGAIAGLVMGAGMSAAAGREGKKYPIKPELESDAKKILQGDQGDVTAKDILLGPDRAEDIRKATEGQRYTAAESIEAEEEAGQYTEEELAEIAKEAPSDRKGGKQIPGKKPQRQEPKPPPIPKKGKAKAPPGGVLQKQKADEDRQIKEFDALVKKLSPRQRSTIQDLIDDKKMPIAERLGLAKAALVTPEIERRAEPERLPWDAHFRALMGEAKKQSLDEFVETGTLRAEAGDPAILDLAKRLGQPIEPGYPIAETLKMVYARIQAGAEPRKRTEEMSKEELQKELTTDYLTGLGNKHAFEIEDKRKAHVASIDLDSLKYFNDAFGHQTGDEILKNFGEALKPIEGSYHISGDEFIVQNDDTRALQDILENQIPKNLAANPITVTLPDGKKIKYEVQFSYGTAKTISDAEQALQAHKAKREATGKRAARGAIPAGLPGGPTKGERAGDKRKEVPKKKLKGRALFTPEQLAEFDRLKIDVSGVTAQYKTEALQQLEFKKKGEGKTPAEYDIMVKREYNRAARARGDKKLPYPDLQALDDEAQAKGIFVDPERLESDQWEDGKKIKKEGDIRGAYSGDKLSDNKIRRPFKYDGSLWTSVGSLIGGDDPHTEAYRLIPFDEYKGKTYSYSERNAEVDAGKRERGSYEGQWATYGKKKYVLTDPAIFRPEAAGEEPGAPAKRLKHFTTKKRAEKIRKEGFLYGVKKPLFGTGGLGEGAKEGRFAGDAIYLSLDDKAWGRLSEFEPSGEAVPATGKEDTAKNNLYYDYEKQSWMARPGVYQETELVGIEYEIEPDTRVLRIDSKSSLNTAMQKYGHWEDPKFWSNIKKDYDAVSIINVKKISGADPESKFFKSVMADQLIILNQEKVRIGELAEEPPKKKKPLKPEEYKVSWESDYSEIASPSAIVNAIKAFRKDKPGYARLSISDFWRLNFNLVKKLPLDIQQQFVDKWNKITGHDITLEDLKTGPLTNEWGEDWDEYMSLKGPRHEPYWKPGYYVEGQIQADHPRNGEFIKGRLYESDGVLMIKPDPEFDIEDMPAGHLIMRDVLDEKPGEKPTKPAKEKKPWEEFIKPGGVEETYARIAEGDLKGDTSTIEAARKWLNDQKQQAEAYTTELEEKKLTDKPEFKYEFFKAKVDYFDSLLAKLYKQLTTKPEKKEEYWSYGHLQKPDRPAQWWTHLMRARTVLNDIVKATGAEEWAQRIDTNSLKSIVAAIDSVDEIALDKEPKAPTNRELTIQRLGNIGTKIRFKAQIGGITEGIKTITNIADNGKISFDDGKTYRAASEFDPVSDEEIKITDRPDIQMAMANETKVITPGNPRGYNARYAVVESDALIPSHNAQTFQKNPEYPEGIQERTYHTDTREQEKVIKNAQHLSNAILLSDDPTPTNGPPIITPAGIVLGGNSRTMSIARAYRGKLGDRYKKALVSSASKWGMSSEYITAMDKPVLVRQVYLAKGDINTLHRMASDFNKSLTQGISQEAEIASMGKNISMGTVERIGLRMANRDLSIRELLGKRDGLEVLNWLIQDDVIPATDENRFVNRKVNLLNEPGKILIEKALFGSIIDDADLISAAPKALINKIGRALPGLATIKARGDQWDITPDVKDALQLATEAHASDLSIREHLAQGSLFGDKKQYNNMAVGLAELLAKEKQIALAKRFDRFANDAMSDIKDQTFLFAPKTFQESFKEAFGFEVADRVSPFGAIAPELMSPKDYLDFVKAEARAGRESGIPYKEKVEIEETGETIERVTDAAAYLNELEDEIAGYRELLNCVKGAT